MCSEIVTILVILCNISNTEIISSLWKAIRELDCWNMISISKICEMKQDSYTRLNPRICCTRLSSHISGENGLSKKIMLCYKVSNYFKVCTNTRKWGQPKYCVYVCISYTHTDGILSVHVCNCLYVCMIHTQTVFCLCVYHTHVQTVFRMYMCMIYTYTESIPSVDVYDIHIKTPHEINQVQKY